MPDTLQQIPIEKLAPSPFNARKAFPKAQLDELADSIRAQGILEPLIVREIPANGLSRFEIVAGERRYRAAQLAELKTLPAIVRELTDVAARELQIIENLQRVDIGPLEEAAAYQDLLQAAGDAKQPLTVKELAARLGKSERAVYARLELRKLSAPVQKALAAGKIQASHAQELVPLNLAQQLETLGFMMAAFEPLDTVEGIRDFISDSYREKPAPPKLSAKEKAERAAEAKRRATEDARWKAQQAKSEHDRKTNGLALERVHAALWPKIKALPAAKLIPLLIESVIGDGWQARQAAKIAGKAAPRLPLAAFVAFQEGFNFYGKPNPVALALAKACGIDPARIRKTAAAELAPQPKAKASPTSAKTGSAEKAANIRKGAKRGQKAAAKIRKA